jgi:hypothetical protein
MPGLRTVCGGEHKVFGVADAQQRLQTRQSVPKIAASCRWSASSEGPTGRPRSHLVEVAAGKR